MPSKTLVVRWLRPLHSGRAPHNSKGAHSGRLRCLSRVTQLKSPSFCSITKGTKQCLGPQEKALYYYNIMLLLNFKDSIGIRNLFLQIVVLGFRAPGFTALEENRFSPCRANVFTITRQARRHAYEETCFYETAQILSMFINELDKEALNCLGYCTTESAVNELASCQFSCDWLAYLAEV